MTRRTGDRILIAALLLTLTSVALLTAAWITNGTIAPIPTAITAIALTTSLTVMLIDDQP